MIKRTQLYQAVATALLLLSGSNLAFAASVIEAEPEGTKGVNDTITTAQQLIMSACPNVVPTQMCAEVQGVLGTVSTTAKLLPDLDFYWFEAFRGNVLDIDIDQGMKPKQDPAKPVRNLNTIVGIFGPLPSVSRVDWIDNMAAPLDQGSDDLRDAYLDNFVVPADGVYVVGVSSQGRFFLAEGGSVDKPTLLGVFSNGSYTLKVSGVIPPIQQVKIDVRPGQNGDANINPKSKGVVPVAILSSAPTASSPEFDALKINHYSMTFGKMGNEKSYVGCLKHGVDVNADGLLDLVCHFDNEAANWDVDTARGILKGVTSDGVKIEGRAQLRTTPRAKDKD